MPLSRPTRPVLLLASLLALASCRSRGEGGARDRAFLGEGQRPAAFDFSHPLQSLRLDAGDAAARAGSFAWQGRVEWTAYKPGVAPIHAVERHRLRQLATGDFHVDAEIDPGTDPSAVTGREVVYAGRMTYARGQWAPFRERPSDGGHDARRFRDDSFRAAASLAELLGPSLRATPAGDATVLGRAARRYALALAEGVAPPAQKAPQGLPDSGYDADTRRHLAFLEGRVPTSASGELVLDAETGVPLEVELRAAFTERDDRQLRVEALVDARVTALGAGVEPVRAPEGALTDERKPKGVARALEAAGLRKRGAPAAERAEPEEEDEEGQGDEAPRGRRETP